jgi:hypothetical protein
MRFLDRIEGDKLRFLDRIEGDNFVVVELHVGPRRQCDALDKQNQVFVVFCQV